MSKDDFIWVLIRGLGFLLVLRALLCVPELIGNVTALVFLGDMSSSGSSGVKTSVDVFRHQLVGHAAACLGYAAVGIYLLRWATWVFRLLSFVSPERSNTAPHADAREASHLDQSSQPRAGGRER